STDAPQHSRLTKIPRISFAGARKTIERTQYALVSYAYEDNNLTGSSIKDILARTSVKTIAVVFGPEGGFTETEADIFKTYENISLGRRILRAETAPLYALSVIGSYYE